MKGELTTTFTVIPFYWYFKNFKKKLLVPSTQINEKTKKCMDVITDGGSCDRMT